MIKKNERGIAMIEYALLIALVAIGIYAATEWDALLTAINKVITDIVTAINTRPS